jgi:hypothetical protein
MLKIRHEQMRQLDAIAVDGFLDRVVEHLQERHREAIEGVSAEDLRRGAEAALAVGRGYGLHTEAVLTGFVALSFVISPGFHRQPTINRVLRRMRFDADQSLDRLTAKTRAADWEEASRLSA